MTRLGEMDKKIVFQSYTLTADGMGGSTESWVDKLTSWAAIWPLSANESLENLKTEHRVTHRIRCYASSSINPKQRIKYQDTYLDVVRYFEIVSLINPNEAYIEFEILAEEILE